MQLVLKQYAHGLKRAAFTCAEDNLHSNEMTVQVAFRYANLMSGLADTRTAFSFEFDMELEVKNNFSFNIWQAEEHLVCVPVADAYSVCV